MGIREALRSDRTYIAVTLRGAVEQRASVMHGATGLEQLAVRADVDTAHLVPVEVRAGENASCRLGLLLGPIDLGKRRTLPLGYVPTRLQDVCYRVGLVEKKTVSHAPGLINPFARHVHDANSGVRNAQRLRDTPAAT